MKTLFQKKLKEAKTNKEKIYKQLKKDANNLETQEYYKNNLEEIDLKIIDCLN
jgi:hypothetical protein